MQTGVQRGAGASWRRQRVKQTQPAEASRIGLHQPWTLLYGSRTA